MCLGIIGCYLELVIGDWLGLGVDRTHTKDTNGNNIISRRSMPRFGSGRVDAILLPLLTDQA